jgi:hypothetical protein
LKTAQKSHSWLLRNSHYAGAKLFQTERDENEALGGFM